MDTIAKLLVFITLAFPAFSQSRKAMLIAPKTTIVSAPNYPTNGLTFYADAYPYVTMSFTNDQRIDTWSNLIANARHLVNPESSKNARYVTNGGGSITFSNASVNGFRGTTNQFYYLGLSNSTVAWRVYFVTSNNKGLFQSGSQSPTKYMYVQFFSGGLYYDWGNASPNRINKSFLGLTGQWLNLIFTRNGLLGNMSIYINGTNWLSGSNNIANTLENVDTPFSLYRGNDQFGHYSKRFLTYNTCLSTSDIATLNTWMSTNAP